MRQVLLQTAAAAAATTAAAPAVMLMGPARVSGGAGRDNDGLITWSAWSTARSSSCFPQSNQSPACARPSRSAC
ncbi:hypothetical protein BC828DRAFT_380723 [Blastocladiella britannica]|nr:hypothetical protein BC828DRAFT_380723 [Blastocladiella britannica]